LNSRAVFEGQFCHGEIETIKIVLQQACPIVCPTLDEKLPIKTGETCSKGDSSYVCLQSSCGVKVKHEAMGVMCL
jgi:hypothetical protein